MSYHLNVRGLAGLHIGQHVTVKTRHTEASGILQGFNCGAMAINDSSIIGDNWILGSTTCGITLLPNQRIVAEMGDKVVVHGKDGPEPAAPQGWEYQDTERHCGCNGNAAHQAEMNGETSGTGD